MKVIRRILIAIVLLALSVVLVLHINTRMCDKVVLKEYRFAHSEVPKGFDGYRILVVSDLHEAPFAEQIAKYINTREPDIVVLTGDLNQLPDDSIDETVKLRKLVRDVPMYAVSGNHERQSGGYDEILAKLWDVDIIPLENDNVKLEKRGDSILLVGVKDPRVNDVTEEYIEKTRNRITRQLPEEPCFSVLLFHRAGMYPYIKDTGVDLILSGDLHGGIVRLPFLGGLIGKNSYLPDYEYGFIKEGDGAAMIVSGGCDKNPKKKRYFNPPEVVLVTLEKE